MDLNAFMQDYANEIGGQYSEYDSAKSIIVVPVKNDRLQTVLGTVKHLPKYDKLVIEFSSKVCPYEQGIDLEELLATNTNFCHAKFVIVDGYVRVEASAFVKTMTEDLLKESIQEVASLADEYEQVLTGADVY